jgi:hypothetical protein
MFCFFKATGGVRMKGNGTGPGTIEGSGGT